MNKIFIEKEPFFIINNSPKSSLLYGIFNDLSRKNQGFFQPTIKKIRGPNIRNFKKARSNENSPKTMINQMNFLTTQQLFVGPMKIINKKLDLSKKNEEKDIIITNIMNTKEMLSQKTERMEKKAKNTIFGFFEEQNKRILFEKKNLKTSENSAFLPEIQKNQIKTKEKLEEKETKRANYQFKPYKEKRKSPEIRYLEENLKNPPLNSPKMKTFRFPEKKIEKNLKEKDEKCSSWSIKSSVSCNLHEEKLIF